MPLESCMILLDNSEFMRNGDYIPTRLEAQQDAANLLVGAKTQSHPESTVGVSAGTELLVSPTDDVGKILNALHGLPMHSSKPDVTASVQVASLALKHRRNKNGAQRIVLFVGSPLQDIDNRTLAKAGRQLKKNNVAIDVVVMGELEENEEKLRELVDAANGRTEEGSERTCHLVTIPAGVLPSDVLASSPIVHGGAGGGGGGGMGGDFGGSGGGGGGEDFGGGGFSEYGGVDPNMDPELAMALRVSMEEERARQERAAAASATSQEGEGGGESKSNEESKDAKMADAGAPAPSPDSAAQATMDAGMSEEEALLQQALAMSMNENEPESGGDDDAKKEEDKKEAKSAAAPAQMDVEDDEDAAMQMALQMSMQQDGSKEDGKEGEFQDPNYVNELMGSVDPSVQNALRDGENEDEDKKKEGDKKE